MLSLPDAPRVIAAAEKKAAEIGQPRHRDQGLSHSFAVGQAF